MQTPRNDLEIEQKWSLRVEAVVEFLLENMEVPIDNTVFAWILEREGGDVERAREFYIAKYLNLSTFALVLCMLYPNSNPKMVEQLARSMGLPSDALEKMGEVTEDFGELVVEPVLFLNRFLGEWGRVFSERGVDVNLPSQPQAEILGKLFDVEASGKSAKLDIFAISFDVRAEVEEAVKPEVDQIIDWASKRFDVDTFSQDQKIAVFLRYVDSENGGPWSDFIFSEWLTPQFMIAVRGKLVAMLEVMIKDRMQFPPTWGASFSVFSDIFPGIMEEPEIKALHDQWLGVMDFGNQRRWI